MLSQQGINRVLTLTKYLSIWSSCCVNSNRTLTRTHRQNICYK